MRLSSTPSRLLLLPVVASVLCLASPDAAATPDAAWPHTSLLAQDEDGGDLPPPDSLQADPADDSAAPPPPPPKAPEDDRPPSKERRSDRAPIGNKPTADGGESPPFDQALREKIPDLPAPALGALGAALPVAAVSAAVLTVNASVLIGALGIGFVAPTAFFWGALTAAAGVFVVSLLGATASVFLAGGAVLWLLDDDATTTEWEHLSMATMATLLFFIVAPALFVAEFFGFPCLSMCCPAGGLNAFAPRISRPLYWTLGAIVAGGLLGMLAGGLVGAVPSASLIGVAGNPLIAVPQIALGASFGLALGATVAAPLGAAVGGSFGIMAPATGE
jgi:hypothetical protein